MKENAEKTKLNYHTALNFRELLTLCAPVSEWSYLLDGWLVHDIWAW